jgi:hypothetical protein
MCCWVRVCLPQNNLGRKCSLGWHHANPSAYPPTSSIGIPVITELFEETGRLGGGATSYFLRASGGFPF